MRIRLRAPGGQFAISLPDDATVGDLITQIIEKTSVSIFEIKYGYPPKALPLEQHERSLALTKLDINLNGETLILSPKDNKDPPQKASAPGKPTESAQSSTNPSTPFSFTDTVGASQKAAGPISLKKKTMEGDVPELPLPDRGATLVLRVMPDDNSCLFRAFGTAVLPGDDLTMLELRSLVASAIQTDPETYSKVVLEQSPDDYCRWIQTQDAWGGAIEMGILSKHFDIEICSIDVKSLRVDKFNEGRPTRCILVYSGIHYDTMVQSPSEPPHTKADSPPEFDKRVWDAEDDEILFQAQQLCRKLQEKHYYTDTGGMAIKCNECGTIVHGEGQAQTHASQTGHYDMGEVPG